MEIAALLMSLFLYGNETDRLQPLSLPHLINVESSLYYPVHHCKILQFKKKEEEDMTTGTKKNVGEKNDRRKK